MNLRIDEDTCIGCGRCAEICPAVFHLNEDAGKAEVMAATPAVVDTAAVRT